MGKKPPHIRELESKLLEYPVLRGKLEVAKYDFPSCVASYKERVQGGPMEYTSSTERFGVKRAEHLEKVMKEIAKIEVALEYLSDKEKTLIKEKYFDVEQPPDEIVFWRLGWSKRHYYRVKQYALEKLAEMLLSESENGT